MVVDAASVVVEAAVEVDSEVISVDVDAASEVVVASMEVDA